ncbi:hypothetical protein CH249_11850 [Rhodococcus sp. 05-2255-3B1]|nr:hypothetical protein CH250_24910 [Rhodococcus sp. 05-2255-3C]OZE11438.1 hypothetical protein CH249_11850 [Rhodococcus sp. 05-2255-3B1]OZE13164.1 hypothetical protein CH255_25270 [Rhodococcus sp. 05-2255-2A2]
MARRLFADGEGRPAAALLFAGSFVPENMFDAFTAEWKTLYAKMGGYPSVPGSRTTRQTGSSIDIRR